MIYYILSIIIGALICTGCIIWKLVYKETKTCELVSMAAYIIGSLLFAFGIVSYFSK